MNNLISLYKDRLGLEDAVFSRIEHDDAIVADVYKVICPDGEQYVLKVCTDTNHYLREVYFLNYFADKLPIPRTISIIPPENGVHGAILMECLKGALLETSDFTGTLVFDAGVLLAQIHFCRVAGFGDLIVPQDLSQDPRVYFSEKFEEGFEECSAHLPKSLLENCHEYCHKHIGQLISVDGPCVVHRDYRPGNIMVNEGKLQGVIDWSSARGGFAEEDFISIEHGEWFTNPINTKQFLEGYASIRPVPDYSEIMLLLRMSKAIATIGFTVKRGTWDNANAHLYQMNRCYLETLFNRI